MNGIYHRVRLLQFGSLDDAQIIFIRKTQVQMSTVKEQKDPEILELARTLRGAPWCEEYEKMISGML